MKIRFYLKWPKRESSSVMMMFAYDSKRSKLYTGISVNPSDWDNEKQRLMIKRLPKGVYTNSLSASEREKRQKAEVINLRLDYLTNTATSVFTTYQNKNEHERPSHDEINNVLKAKFQGKEIKERNTHHSSFFAFLGHFIEEAPNRKTSRTKDNNPLTARTISQYRNLKKTLLEFEDFSKYKVDWNTINLEFHHQFTNYCESIKKFSNEQQGKLIKNIKAICRRASSEGVTIHPELNHADFFKPTLTRENQKDVYVNLEEIEALKNLELDEKESKFMEWFIIGLNTGLRISDFLRLSMDNVNDGFIEIRAFKGKKHLAIPISQDIQNILEKYQGFPPRVTEQDFNSTIKELCKMVGMTEPIQGRKIEVVEVIGADGKKTSARRKIDGVFPKYELISSHSCRRSFATNHYGKIDTPTIMAITGHTSEAVFLRYVRKTPKEHAIAMQNYWKSKKTN